MSARLVKNADAPATQVARPSLFTSAAATCSDVEVAPMLLAPFLVQGSIVSMVAKIKCGKTAFAMEMVRCGRAGASFCGFDAPATPFRSLYATEQARASFVKQLCDAGLHHEHGVIVTYLSAWRGRPWLEIAPVLIETALTEGCSLLVIDTLSRWFGFRADEENHAGAADHVQQLSPYVAKGGTVLMNRHGRKAGGSVADAGRGSGAIDGAVDTILHLYRPANSTDDTREIEAVGRFDLPRVIRVQRTFPTSPPIEIGDGEEVGPKFIFTRIDTSEEGTPTARVLSALSTGGKTIKALAAELGRSTTTIDRAIKELMVSGVICAIGKTGARNNAPVYGLKEKENSPPKSLKGGDVEVSVRRCPA